MLKIIVNNPYRFLGVCSNSSARERVANTGRLKAYLKVGKDVSFPLDLSNIIPAVHRTMEDMDSANNSINIPTDQLKYALFWFVNGDSINQMALDHLKTGNTVKALELFGKKENTSSLINRGVMAFINENDGEAIKFITKVIHNTEYRNAFVNEICGATFQISEDDLAQLFIDTLLEEIPVARLKNLFEQFGTSSNDNDILKQKAIGQYIAAINSAIAEAKSVKVENASAQLQAGTKLMNTTKADLQAVSSILGASDMQYKMTADNLARQILQCGINYYNNTNEDDDVSIDKAMVLSNYAFSIAVGKMIKDRCKENVDILKKKKTDLPPSAVKNEVESIHNALAIFCKKPDKICHSEELLNSTKPHLQSMRNKLGATNAFYLKISTLVVNNALHNIIEEVNVSQSVLGSIKSTPSLLLAGLLRNKEVIEKAWALTRMMDNFDMEYAYRNGRFNENKETLRNMRSQIESILSTLTNPYDSSPSRSYQSSSSDDTNWGCIIVCAIIFGIFCLSQCH